MKFFSLGRRNRSWSRSRSKPLKKYSEPEPVKKISVSNAQLPVPYIGTTVYSTDSKVVLKLPPPSPPPHLTLRSRYHYFCV